jgi:hypothetical protein
LRPGAKKCPECREVLKQGRRVSLYVGIVGIFLMLMVVVVGLLLAPNSVSDDPQGDEARQDQPAKPSPPPKEPPLNR